MHIPKHTHTMPRLHLPSPIFSTFPRNEAYKTEALTRGSHLEAVLRPKWGEVNAFQVVTHPIPIRQPACRGGDSFFHCFN